MIFGGNLGKMHIFGERVCVFDEVLVSALI